MQKYARVVDSIVLEVFTPPAAFPGIDQCFTPQVVALFEACPSVVEAGWIKKPDGSFETPPPPTVVSDTAAPST